MVKINILQKRKKMMQKFGSYKIIAVSLWRKSKGFKNSKKYGNGCNCIESKILLRFSGLFFCGIPSVWAKEKNTNKKCQDARDVASIEALADDYDTIHFHVVINVLKNQISSW